jgi:tetratricopeptide (TPR) repeat protein
LTGTTPFDKERLRQASYDEIRQIIREEEPPRPSTRLSTLGQAVSTASANRRSDPKRLSQLCCGELDWVVMKALEKDRSRRYESASALAADVQRYLADEPVLAGPPRAGYRLRKFARRHWRPLVVAAGFVGLLAAAVVGLALAVVLIDRERTQTQEALVAQRAAKARARQALNDLFSQVIEDWFARQGDPTPEQKEFLTRALASYEAFAEEEGSDPETRAGVADAYLRTGVILGRQGRDAEALRALERAEADFRALAAGDPMEQKYRRGLALALRYRAVELSVQRQPAEADAPLAEAVEQFGRLAAEQPGEPGPRADLADALIRQVAHLRETRRPAEALAIVDRALPLQQHLADQFPDLATYQLALAELRSHKATLLADKWRQARLPLSPSDEAEARSDEAEMLANNRRALEVYERFARRSPPVPEAQRHAGRMRLNLAITHRNGLDDEAAVDEFRRAEGWLVPLIGVYPKIPEYRMVLGQTYLELCRSLVRLRQAAAAAEVADKAHRTWKELVDQNLQNPGYKLGLASAEGRVGDARLLAGEVEEAVRRYGWAIDGAQGYRDRLGVRVYVNSDLAEAHAGRAAAHERAGRLDEALADWDRAIGYGEQEGGNSLYHVGKAMTLTRAGRAAEGEASLAQLHRNLQAFNGETCFHAACACALLAAASPADADRARKVEGMGIDFLKRDDKHGLFRIRQWAERLRSEPELQSLRGNPAVKGMMGRPAEGQK